jgi:hypothetical protein
MKQNRVKRTPETSPTKSYNSIEIDLGYGKIGLTEDCKNVKIK